MVEQVHLQEQLLLVVVEQEVLVEVHQLHHVPLEMEVLV
tara:strand:- start:264 stop:380 length:117 start_codon:yes stop_codon:yes gene_type:complete